VKNLRDAAALARPEDTGESDRGEKRNRGDDDQDLSAGGGSAPKLCQRRTHYYSRERIGFQSYEKDRQSTRGLFSNLNESVIA
jgi:hypothetical protein